MLAVPGTEDNFRALCFWLRRNAVTLKQTFPLLFIRCGKYFQHFNVIFVVVTVYGRQTAYGQNFCEFLQRVQ
jgi:hypothetical protein